MTSKQVDFLVMGGALVGGSLFSYVLDARNVLHGFLFLGLPSLYLCIRQRKNYKKIFWGVLIFGVLLGGIFDMVMVINRAWDVPRLTIPIRLFGFWGVDTILGYAFMTLFILIFYEHFLDRDYHRRLSPRHAKLFFWLLIIFVLVMILAAYHPSALQFHYAYLWSGLAGIIFPIVFGFLNPKIIPKFAMLSVFFFFVWFLLENVGMRLGGWIFPSTEYIGMVSFRGITFPLEEILFWMLWYPATIVAYYEYFIDDGK